MSDPMEKFMRPAVDALAKAVGINPDEFRISIEEAERRGFMRAVEMLRGEDAKAWSVETFKGQGIYNVLDVADWLEERKP